MPKTCQENAENLENFRPVARWILVRTHQTTATVQARLVVADPANPTGSGTRDSGLDVLSLRLGGRHFDLGWLGSAASGANPWRDGVVSGILGAGAANGGMCE